MPLPKTLAQKAKDAHRKKLYREQNPEKIKASAKDRSDGVPKIYFIRAGTAVKIGFTTKKPWARMTELQGGNPEEMVMLFFLPGSQAQEKALHHKFSHLHLRGEWFRLEQEILNEIEKLKIHGATTA